MVRPVIAESLANVSDSLDISSVNLATNHVFHFTTSVDIGNNGYFEITLPAPFGDVWNGSCSGSNVTVSTTTTSIRCTYSTTPGAATTTEIRLFNVDNPSADGVQHIDVKTYNSGSALQENSDIAVFITQGISTTLHINGSLAFDMIEYDGTNTVNGIPLTGSSTTTTIPFGNLVIDASSTLAQTLSISTNASNGFSCTVQQDAEMLNGGGSTINSFDNSSDNTGSTTPHTWNDPTGTLGSDYTYGHLGITTDDPSLQSLDYTGSKFIGLNNTDPIEIFYNGGPADGTTVGVGRAHIAYSVMVTGLQEAGDYESKITYVCTGNY